MAIAILPPLKQFRRHQLLRKKDCPPNYQQSKNNQPQISQKLCQPNHQFLNSSQSAISESNMERFEFHLAMLQKGAEELEKKIANFNTIEGYCWRLLGEHPSLRVYQLVVEVEGD